MEAFASLSEDQMALCASTEHAKTLTRPEVERGPSSYAGLI